MKENIFMVQENNDADPKAAREGNKLHSVA